MSTVRPGPTGVSVRRAAAAAALGLVALLAAAPLASAREGADGAIVNVDRSDSGLELSLDVPADVDVDLGGVTATVDGQPYDATAARITGGDGRVRRTTVLAIDTSNSMAGSRFEAAKVAAETFLDTVPDDVAVGILSFDSDVQTELAPTTDRDQARAVVAGLRLSRQTLLYDGIIEAVALTGTDGQRAVLVLSDGADTSGTPLTEVTSAIKDSRGVVVDVVALEQSGSALGVLSSIVGRTGDVIAADSQALAAAFSAEAEVLTRQVAVSVVVPPDVAGRQVDITVTLPTSAGDVVATTTALAVDRPATSDPLQAIPQPTAASAAAGTPAWLVYVGVGVFGAGLLVALVLLVPGKPVPMSPEARVASYAVTPYGTANAARAEPETALKQQASEAIAGVLQRNQGLDDRITQRLEAAGSELKSSEWLLVHAGLFVAISTVGLLLGRGNVVLGLLFMLVGAVGPWVYLGQRGRRRRKAFDAALPETLQLMSGSLSAGLSLMQSVDTIVREGAEPIASAFRRVLVETRIGVSLEDALDGVADRFDSRDFRWVVMAIKIQRQVGGNLAELLNTVASTMREREYMRRQVAALSAEGKLSAIVLGSLPPIFLLYLLVAQRDYVTVLFTDPRGIIMIVGATLWLGVGVFWMSKLVKVEV